MQLGLLCAVVAMTVLVLVLVVQSLLPRVTQQAQGAVPCGWACDDPVCEAQCTAECREVSCTLRPAPLAGEVAAEQDPTLESCRVVCPTGMDATQNCPQCATVCPATPDSLVWACAPTACTWRCAPPPACPHPRCTLECPEPACAST